MKGIRFDNEADRELDDAVRYYEQQSDGLGRRLLEDVGEALIFIRQYPEGAPRIIGSVRRIPLANFPYSLLYELVRGGRIRILAVAHQNRHPRYWLRRM